MNYFEQVKKLSKSEIRILELAFGTLRDRFVMYKLRGDGTRSAVNNALFDAFEGDDDFRARNPKFDWKAEHIVRFCSIVLVFGDKNELQLYLDLMVSDKML